MSYDSFMTKAIDCLINLQNKECDNPERHDNNTGQSLSNTSDRQPMVNLMIADNAVNLAIDQDRVSKKIKHFMTSTTPLKVKVILPYKPLNLWS